MRWPACKAEYPPAVKGGVRAACSRRYGHFGDHQARDSNGTTVQKWWQGWSRPPAAGGKPLLTRRKYTLLLVVALSMCFGQWFALHLATRHHQALWLTTLGFIAYTACWYTYFHCFKARYRDTRRRKDNQAIINRRTTGPVTVTYKSGDGNVYTLPASAVTTVIGGLTPQQIRDQIDQIARKVEELHEVTEMQQQVLLGQVTNPRET